MRKQPELDSKDGIVRADLDHIVHRYTFPQSGRKLQAIMLIEVKTYVDFSKPEITRIQQTQADSLHVINQLFRNRRSNIHKKAKWQAGAAGTKAYSICSKRNVWVRFYGVHGLYFSNAGPEDSHCIKWDHKEINIIQLKRLLRFELDPDTLINIDLRIHQKKQHSLFEDELYDELKELGS
ncbi:MAG: hypothetical protein ACYSUX_07435 [Planctomycetota bacterium]|jgi:hypothetical protein